MSHWNYRIVRHQAVDPQGTPVEWYGMHEVFYGDDDEPTSMTREPVIFVGDSVDELKGSLALALKDADERPVFEVPEAWAENVPGTMPADDQLVGDPAG